jgi:hypothetical protein
MREAGGLPAVFVGGSGPLDLVHGDQPENVLIAASRTMTSTIPIMRSAAFNRGCVGLSGPVVATPQCYGSAGGYRAPMGVLDDALKKVLRAARGASGPSDDRGPAWGPRDPDPSGYGKAGAPTPDLDALVTDAEIEALTGAAPVGEPRRNGPDGSEVDLGRHVIREVQLANGDEFLVALGNCTDARAAQLSMDRVAEVEKPLAGVGERGLVRVKKHPKRGTSEIGVTALQGNFTLSLVHTSNAMQADPAPLTELLRTALTRL